MTNPTNEVPTYTPTPDDMERVFARTTEAQRRQADAQRRAEVWPAQVDATLAALAGRAVSHDEALAAIGARLSALEAKLGIKRG